VWAALGVADRPSGYAAAHALLTANPGRAWTAYVVGCLVVLQHERGLRLDQGLRLMIASEVPAGKGVSSSAALEVAVMGALCAVYHIEIDGRELALLCQKVENLVVGAPCGIMDQMTSACGQSGELLALLCQPAELQEPVALPPAIEVWGIDSGIRHAVSGADYGSVRVGAFMGYRMIADLAGLAVLTRPDRRVAIADTVWQGYLANIPPSLWEVTYRDQIPMTIDGAAFLERYGGTSDAVTQIDPARVYAVRQPTAHPIYEHHRVRLFRALLGSLTNDQRPTTNEDRGLKIEDSDVGGDKTQSSILYPLSSDQTSLVVGPGTLWVSEVETAILLGELMYQSHASYSACGLGADGTDRLVELVRRAGPPAGLFGAKITGGGSGGTVAVLAQHGSAASIQAIAAQYERETGHPATILGGSSPGALAFGSRRLVRV
jgi:L-arabinokinase